MRKVIGVLLMILGIPILAAGAYAAILIGPDDTAETGPHRISSDGSAIVTTPDVLAYVGPTMHLTVTSPSGGDVFVGIGPRLDVTSYVGDAPHREVTDVVLPWQVTSAEVGSGTPVALAPPDEQPWWIKQASGAGSATLEWPIVDGSYRILGANGDGSPGVELDVTLGLELEGAFYGALAGALAGLLLVLLGLLMLLWRRLRFGRAPAAAEPVVVGAAGTQELPYPPPATYEPAAFERPEPRGVEDTATQPTPAVAAPVAAAPVAADPISEPADDPTVIAEPATEPTQATGTGQPAWPFSDLEPDADAASPESSPQTNPEDTPDDAGADNGARP